ncbi:cache domain-containing sensor histidine kinase [Gracilibacillus massiliensis]|uniref:cache domain-containing sensor histidine kinase n=1 Tax=Gracilibacillus massiliensis TaxID=1564956 RepID=UPI00071C990D|nr:sensor histidine kinase [Gracilibacillus massiliensis]
MKNTVKKLNQLSLRSRLIIAVIVCILLPWISTYFVSNYITKDVLEERATNQANESLSLIEVNIKNILDDVMYASNYIQFDTGFNQIMKEHQAIDPSSSRASQEIALNYIEMSNRLSSITDVLAPSYFTILFSNDLFYTNYPLSEYYPLDFYDRPWFDKLKASNYYDTLWIGAHPTYISSEHESDPYLISVGKNLQQATQYDTYLIVSIKEKQFRSLLETYQQENNSEYFLTDQSGKVYSSVDESFIDQQLPYDVNQSNYQIVNRNGQDYFLVSYPVSYSNWRLVSLIPYQETIGNINRVTNTTILIQGALLLLFLIGLIALVRELTKPLTELNAVTKSVENGDLSRRAKLSGNNDIANLGYSFNEMLDTIEEMIDEVRLREQEKRTAELEMLQAQINPHFLFNVLNAIRLQIKLNGDKHSADLIHALSSLLRMTINRNNPFITLAEELDIIDHYTRLMNFRHQHEVELTYILEDETKKVEVPRFFLQPVIENAIIHGYNERNGSIVIYGVILDDNVLKLQITDDGIGMDEEELKKIKAKIFETEYDSMPKNHQSFNGIGIKNVYQRMKMIYGNQFSMELESEKNVGASYTFYLPIEKE